MTETVNPSGPLVRPPDCETARTCLLRRVGFYAGTINAFYLPVEKRTVAADKMVDLGKALDLLAEVEP